MWCLLLLPRGHYHQEKFIFPSTVFLRLPIKVLLFPSRYRSLPAPRYGTCKPAFLITRCISSEKESPWRKRPMGVWSLHRLGSRVASSKLVPSNWDDILSSLRLFLILYSRLINCFLVVCPAFLMKDILVMNSKKHNT